VSDGVAKDVLFFGLGSLYVASGGRFSTLTYPARQRLAYEETDLLPSQVHLLVDNLGQMKQSS
jgi:hypothetical protein